MKVASSKILSARKPLMRELLEALLAEYSYASILGSDSDTKVYTVSGSGITIGDYDFMTELGYVVKVYDGESYGEYAFNELTKEKIKDILLKIKESLVPWANQLPEEVAKNVYGSMEDEKISFEKSSEYELEPNSYGDDKVIALLSDLREKTIAADPAMVDAQVGYEYQVYHKIFLSKNKDLTQNVIISAGSLVGIAMGEDDMKIAMRQASGNRGIELLNGLEEQIPDLARSIQLQLKAKPMIPGEYDCICDPEVTGLIAHEAFGHGVEMDMFVKDRALAKYNVGEQLASTLVTMHDGAAAFEQTGSFFFDDEGTIAQDTIILEKGILKTGICDAQAALALNHKPTGNGRRESSSHKAYTRMTNTFFEPGTDKLEDMIASIDYGFLITEGSSGMEDPKNWGIQVMTSLAQEIKDGKLTGNSFGPVVMSGYVPDLLKSISMMSDGKELIGCGFCGKGYKELVKTSQGGPYIKAKIRLG